MRLSSEELKQLYRARTARVSVVECPSADALVNAGSDEISLEERTRLADHLVACSDCAREYRLILESAPNLERNRAAEASSVGQRTGVRPGARAVWAGMLSRPRWLIIGALTMLILIGGSLAVWRASGPGERLRESVRGAPPVLMDVQPPDHTELDAAPGQLVWSAVESAESYRVALFDYLSTPLWESDPTAIPSVTVPESVRQRLDRGRPVYWRVSVRKGIESYRSELFQFSIRAD